MFCSVEAPDEVGKKVDAEFLIRVFEFHDRIGIQSQRSLYDVRIPRFALPEE
jgi:hypothetical protein